MAAFRIAAQMIAYQAVEAIEILPHVCRAGCNIYPRRRSKPEHRLRPVQYGQQALQCFRIESTTHFDSAPPLQLNKQNTVAPGIVAAIPRRGGNHFDGNKSSSSQLPSTMHALTIFIERPYRQASLMAKSSPQQSTRFKLRNQRLNLGKTTSPVLHSHFAHRSSAPLNAAQEQSALLRRIRHFGLFANRRRRAALERCRSLLGLAERADPQEPPSLRCPTCSGIMLVVERLTYGQLYFRPSLTPAEPRRSADDTS